MTKKSYKCKICNRSIKPDCDWQQGRCPHRQVSPLIQRIINFLKGIIK